MRLPSLDERLSCAAALFPACAYGADIGADHGRLSCYMLATGKCERMCVADISAESLEKARRLIALHGLSERADIRVGDGLSALDRPADAIAILGMGGRTLSDILVRGKERMHRASLVLSAHTQLPLLRRTLMQLSYHIEEEKIARAAGRFYVVLRAEYGAVEYSERELLLGPCLIKETDENYAGYLAWRIGVAACERTESAAGQLALLREEYDRVCNGSGD